MKEQFSFAISGIKQSTLFNYSHLSLFSYMLICLGYDLFGGWEERIRVVGFKCMTWLITLNMRC